MSNELHVESNFSNFMNFYSSSFYFFLFSFHSFTPNFELRTSILSFDIVYSNEYTYTYTYGSQCRVRQKRFLSV